MPTNRKRMVKVLSKVQRLARERAIIRDLRAGKMSYRKIAERHHVSLPTVNAKARKAGITRSRRGPAAFVTTKAIRRTRTTRKTTTPTFARTTRRYTRRTVAKPTFFGRGTRSPEKFNESFRWLVMNYYPNMPLKKFERLTKMISKVIS